MRAWMLFCRTFFDERVGLLDYFNPSDSLIFFDELTGAQSRESLPRLSFQRA